MTSRERVRRVLNHQEADRVPVDLGSSPVTGIQASMYAQLKEALGITTGAITVYEPYQMLAEVEEPVKQALGVDTAGIEFPVTIFGYKNENWKPFTMFDGTEVLISGHFEYDVLENGDIVQYPKGDRSAPPSGIMPKDGYYFDSIVRQEPIEEDKLDAKEWVEQSYSVYTDEDLRFLEETARHYYDNTEYALLGNFWGAGFGDIAFVPGPAIPYPKGIRDPQEWYMSTVIRKQYVKDIYHYAFEIQMKNLELYYQAVGDRLDIVVMSGTDFGSQRGPFISQAAYRELYKPLHKTMNDWVHEHTNWKTFFHTCGSIIELMDDFYEAGIDILNPVQVSAKGMDPEFLKTNYGEKFVFWGGAVNPQQTLPFGTPEAVREEVAHNLNVFKQDGGFVFNNVHNIQSNIPIENLMAMFETLKDQWAYS
ncbi:methyltransferase [candidate division KSB3 bacterium]|uniref:Methyltransferase n=1 Tax=candidate division KSB3 bacterium TaxID=2044937 RepID=A0A9D5JZ60_9BACT|nr:methyltransferase [candidate division KSB3 bacterium]MBD3326957.1 methyltransferase [candidate division KSB3 bacterium]